MNAWKSVLVLATLLTASTAAAQRATRISGRSLGTTRAIGMIGDGFSASAVVFDANTDTVLGSVALGFGNNTCYGDGVITSDLTRAYAVTVSSALWVIDLTTTPPSLVPGSPILLPTFAVDLALTNDERFLLVCGGNAALNPLIVIDVATLTIVDDFTIRGVGVDVAADGSVLVADDFANRVVRLTLDSAGVLATTGENFGEADPINVSFAPGGAVGLVVNWRAATVRSFAVPGLALIDTLTTVAPGFMVCALVDPNVNRVYTRKDSTLQAYSFDAATGDLGDTPVWNVTPGFATTCYGVDQLALHPDGTKLYVPAPNAVQIRDPATGALLGSITHPDLIAPSGMCIAGVEEVEEIPAAMDIRPGACPNSFNPYSHGVLPVALVGADDFDVGLVDVATLRLTRADGVGESVAPNEGPQGPHTQISDVSEPSTGEPCACKKLESDGIPDLVAKFKTDALVSAMRLDEFSPGALVELVLTGELQDGTPFSARDCVRFVPPGTPPGALTISTARNGWVQASPLDLQLDGGGFGRFERTYPLGTRVTLTAFEIEGLPFVAWEVDGVPQKLGERTLVHHVRGEHANVRALYGPKRSLR